MMIGPHHAAVTHAGGSSEVGQREQQPTWFGWVFTESAGLSSCVLVTTHLGAPPRQVGAVWPAGCARSAPLRRPPPLAHRRRARGRSPIEHLYVLTTWDATSHMQLGLRLRNRYTFILTSKPHPSPEPGWYARRPSDLLTRREMTASLRSSLVSWRWGPKGASGKKIQTAEYTPVLICVFSYRGGGKSDPLRRLRLALALWGLRVLYTLARAQ
jgi:hypothetical protein